jgi:cation transport ATPase
MDTIIQSFGNLFVCQSWCGYMDNLLSEVNLSLFALNGAALPTTESVQLMEDGEVKVLEKNLAQLIAYEQIVKQSLKNSKDQFKSASSELEEMKKRLNAVENTHIGSIEAVLDINTENLAHLPSQFESLEVLFKELYGKMKKTEKTLQKEKAKRKTSQNKKQRRRLTIYPFIIVLSIILALLGFQMFSGYVTVALVMSGMLLQLFYWATYVLFLRSLNAPRRYPSFAFRQVHFFSFALAESLYMFTTTANVLTPATPEVLNPRV